MKINKKASNSGVEAVTEVDSAEKTQSIGQVLKAARLAQVMSAQDIARQLRLSEKQIEAIEEDDHSKFPNQIFLRGFIRNYAKLVREDTKKFSQLLGETFPPTSTQAITFSVDGTPFIPDHKKSKGNLIILLIVVLVSSLLVYEVYRSGGDDPKTNENIENGTVAETIIQLETETETETEIEQAPEDNQNQLSSVIKSNGSDFNVLVDEVEVDQQGGDSLDKEQNVEMALELEVEVEDKLVESEGGGTLRFIFTGESWVEVKDAEGKKIFAQTSPDNTEETVNGSPPFSLIIGNAASVRLFYNDELVDLIPYTNTNGGVARLSLD
jgi:cytoskeleton protein RodZ